MRRSRRTPNGPPPAAHSTIPPGEPATQPETTRISGGASFTSLTVSRPLAVLTLSTSGVSIDLRSRLVKRILSRFLNPSALGWMTEWTNLGPIDLAQRSVILRATGQAECRFNTLTHRRLQPLIDELRQRNIPVTKVRTTIGWYLNRT
jgi:hypothetical protein